MAEVRRFHKYAPRARWTKTWPKPEGRKGGRPIDHQKRREAVLEAFEEFCCRQFERVCYRLSDEGEKNSRGGVDGSDPEPKAPTHYYRTFRGLGRPSPATHDYEHRR